MTTTVEPSSDVMVKPPIITRKSRQFQTAVERWSSLRQNSSRSFDRLNLRNKFEEDRLVQKHRDISELSDAQLKELFRIKNEMRVALVDIARSKRQYSSKESEFESRLRTGNQSPIFKMEYRRLRKKQVELGKLCEQLQGPNSKLLASNLTSELKAVEAKAEKEALRGEPKYKSKWLAPLKTLSKVNEDSSDTADASRSSEAAASAKPTGNDFANLVKMVHKQFKRASISGKDSAQTIENKNERTQETTEPSKTLPTHSKPETVRESTKTQGHAVRQSGSENEQLRPPSRPPPKAMIPIASAISLLETSPAQSAEEPVAAKRKKRIRKDTEDQSLPTVREVTEPPTPNMPKEPELPSKPKPKKNKKQKARAVVIKGMHKGTDAHVSRTESAHRRDRLMKKRLSDLAIRTKEDIANRRSISPHEEALSSIHQAEVVARLQLARSKVGITLPEVRTEKGGRKARRASKDQTSISLPPVNIEGRLLRELKEQRRKHKSQSTGLPKLP